MSLIETNIMLLAHVWEWFNAGEQEAAATKGRLKSHITHTNEDWKGRKMGGHL